MAAWQAMLSVSSLTQTGQIALDGYLKMNGWENDSMGVGISDTHHMIGWVKYAYNARGKMPA